MTWTGAAILLVGIVITVSTYRAAKPGEHYFVAWGAVVFGGWRFLRGLYFLANPSELVSKR